MKIKDILPIVEQELRDEYGFKFNDFRLEELYPLESSYIQPMTVSFLLSEEKPSNVCTATALNVPYTRIYKKIDFNMNAGKIAQMRIFAE
ncbi:MAG: hypothetical protein ACTTH8_02195 [Treponema sp.]